MSNEITIEQVLDNKELERMWNQLRSYDSCFSLTDPDRYTIIHYSVAERGSIPNVTEVEVVYNLTTVGNGLGYISVFSATFDDEVWVTFHPQGQS